MSSNYTTSHNKGRKTQRPSTLQYVCQPAALSTACQPGTYEGSPSPYTATPEDDSVAVTGTGGPPPSQYMMSTAVPWDRGSAYTASPAYVNQQPGHQQQPMRYEPHHHQESYGGAQGTSHVEYQQPGPNPHMSDGYHGHSSGEGQPPSGHYHGWSQQQGYPQQGYPQQGSQPQDFQQHGFQQHGSQQQGFQQYGYPQNDYNNGGGRSG